MKHESVTFKGDFAADNWDLIMSWCIARAIGTAHYTPDLKLCEKIFHMRISAYQIVRQVSQ